MKKLTHLLYKEIGKHEPLSRTKSMTTNLEIILILELINKEFLNKYVLGWKGKYNNEKIGISIKSCKQLKKKYILQNRKIKYTK
jgi:hypothetical protein